MEPQKISADKLVQLKMLNVNNRLNCDGFIQLGMAPPHETIREKDFEKIYHIRFDGKEIFVVLVDFLRLKFDQVSDIFTIPAEGINAAEWKNKFLKSHPSASKETEIAVYCWKKVDDPFEA